MVDRIDYLWAFVLLLHFLCLLLSKTQAWTDINDKKMQKTITCKTKFQTDLLLVKLLWTVQN